jgi:hypothetical protein
MLFAKFAASFLICVNLRLIDFGELLILLLSLAGCSVPISKPLSPEAPFQVRVAIEIDKKQVARNPPLVT